MAQVHAWNNNKLFEAYRKVEDAFVELKPDKDSYTFLTLRDAMNGIQKADRNIGQSR